MPITKLFTGRTPIREVVPEILPRNGTAANGAGLKVAEAFAEDLQMDDARPTVEVEPADAALEEEVQPTGEMERLQEARLEAEAEAVRARAQAEAARAELAREEARLAQLKEEAARLEEVLRLQAQKQVARQTATEKSAAQRNRRNRRSKAAAAATVAVDPPTPDTTHDESPAVEQTQTTDVGHDDATAPPPPPPPAPVAEEKRTQRTCAVEFWRGYRKAAFYARALDADGAVAVAESPMFRARGNGIPEETDEAIAAYAALVDRLEADGWRAVADGSAWFDATFAKEA